MGIDDDWNNLVAFTTSNSSCESVSKNMDIDDETYNKLFEVSFTLKK